MKTRDLLALLSVSFIVLYFFVLPEDAMVRAVGGGGGFSFSTSSGSGSGGGGIVGIIIGIIMAPFLLIYSIFSTVVAAKRKRQCKLLLEKMAAQDSFWSPDKLKKNIEIAYLKVQQAWGERNQDIAKEYMSEHLYTKA